jgi:hypothetical protein
MIFRCLLACLSVSAFAAEEAAFWEDCFGPSTVVSVSGNRRLTVAVDKDGRMVSCRWLRPGAPNQLSAGTAAQWMTVGEHGPEALGGDRWKTVDLDLDAPDAPLITSRFRQEEGTAEIEQQLFVAAGHDVMLSRLSFPQNLRPVRLYWRQSFAPNAETASKRLVTLSEPKPPASPRHLQEKGRYYIFSPSAGTTGETLWIGIAALGAELLDLSETGSSETDRLLVLAPNKPVITLCTAFGVSLEDVDEKLDAITALGWTACLEETWNFWQAWLGEWGTDADSSPAALHAARALLTLGMATSTQIQPTLWAPVSEPPMALVLPRQAAWCMRAFQEANKPAEATRQIEFLLENLRLDDAPGRPRGSMPLALDNAGREPFPHLFLQAEATAWTLSACWRYVQGLPEQEVAETIAKYWPQISAGADFLSQWIHAPTGVPLPSFSFRAGRDQSQPEALIYHHMGLHAAFRLAQAGQREPASVWIRVRDDLENKMRFRTTLLDENALSLPRGLPQWLLGVVEQDREALWDLPVQTATGQPTSLRDAAKQDASPWQPRAIWDTLAAAQYVVIWHTETRK